MANEQKDVTNEQKDAICREAKSWLGTPFHHHAQVKGVGVDCGHFVRLVYNAALGLQLPEPAHYSAQWNLHREKELYLEYLAEYAAEVSEIERGDVLVFLVGRTYSHGVLVLDAADRLGIHAMQGHGVVYAKWQIDGFLKYRDFKAYRMEA